MAVSLSKGGDASMSKEATSLYTSITVGLGLNARVTDSSALDLDASAFLLDEGDRVCSIHLSKVPGDVQKITSSASIRDAEARTQNITINIG